MEELIKFLEKRIEGCSEAISFSNIAHYDSLMECHKFACKREAFQEVLKHIKDVKERDLYIEKHFLTDKKNK